MAERQRGRKADEYTTERQYFSYVYRSILLKYPHTWNMGEEGVAKILLLCLSASLPIRLHSLAPFLIVNAPNIRR